VNRRQAILALGGIGAVVVGVPVGWTVVTGLRFPSDHTPEGAYLRIALAFGKNKVRDSFPYLETAAQNAMYTVLDFRKRSLALVRASFAEPERTRWIEAWQLEGDAADPQDLWAALAARNGWDTLMRRDLSGVARVEIAGERATVETMHGTRYAFRRADNGIWGLTLFTADLLDLKERSAHDFAVTERAAQDYERAKTKP
jgi:hypothetical protein